MEEPSFVGDVSFDGDPGRSLAIRDALSGDLTNF